jgi:hypothetical protein
VVSKTDPLTPIFYCEPVSLCGDIEGNLGTEVIQVTDWLNFDGTVCFFVDQYTERWKEASSSVLMAKKTTM